MSLKKIITLSCFFFSFLTYGQLKYGAKAGVMLNASGSIMNAASDLSSIETINENTIGYFIGGFASIDLLFLYVRPELQFSYLDKNFDSLSLSQSRLEAPISVGYKLLPILSVFGGPTLRYNFEPEIENVSISSIEDQTTLGLHIGVRAHLGPLNADIRFDRGLNPNEVSLLENNGIPTSGRIDTRVSVWSLGLSYSF